MNQATDVQPLTLADYLNPARFPATTQEGASAKCQLLAASFNLSSLRWALEEGYSLDQEQQNRLRELEEKQPHMRRLGREVM
jgi:hypothetical protein